jgi:opacity protein-like surface antigen
MLSTFISSIKTSYITAVCLIAPFIGLGQYSELSLSGGLANYWGDLNPSQFVDNFEQSGLNASIGYHYHFGNGFALRGDVSYFKLHNSDSLNEDELKRQRNLSFKSNVWELSVTGELHPLELIMASRGMLRVSPYGVLGVSGFYFEPKTEYQDETVDLRSLGTEGQGIDGFDDKYSPFSLALPAGVGMRFYLTDAIAISIEGIMRFTITDYIDDVSGLYPDYDLVFAENGELAAALSERNDEFLGEAEGSQIGKFIGGDRGNADINDYFSSIALRLHFYLGEGVQSPFSIFKGGNRKTVCPTF